MENDPYKSLHKIADGILEILEKYKTGTEFIGEKKHIINILMRMTLALESSKVNLGEKDNPASNNIDSFKDLRAKIDEITKEVSLIKNEIKETWEKSEIDWIKSQYGYEVSEWIENN